jgi:GntR family transcriptional regulator
MKDNRGMPALDTPAATADSTAAHAPSVAPAAALEPAPSLAPSFRPLYQQIKALLTRSLQTGEWSPGQSIPSELELAARFKVSQGTVRKAIDELATENLLVRRQGKGTFVATHAEVGTQYRFLRLTADDGSAAALQRRLLDCRRMRPPADVAAALRLESGEPAVQVRRLLLTAPAPAAAGQPQVSARPVVLDDLWLPGSQFAGLTHERLDAWHGPLYQLFEAEFSVRMIRAEERLRAVAAEPEDAALLGVASGAPLLSVERLAYTYGDRPVELRRGLYHTLDHHYRNELG